MADKLETLRQQYPEFVAAMEKSVSDAVSGRETTDLAEKAAGDVADALKRVLQLCTSPFQQSAVIATANRDVLIMYMAALIKSGADDDQVRGHLLMATTTVVDKYLAQARRTFESLEGGV